MADWKAKLKETAKGKKEEGTEDVGRAVPKIRIKQFIEETAAPAFEELKTELSEHGREVEIHKEKARIEIRVLYGGQEEFRYAVEGRAHHESKGYFPSMDGGKAPRKCQARVAMPGGKLRDWKDLDDFDRQGIIDDFIEAYDKWIGWERGISRFDEEDK